MASQTIRGLPVEDTAAITFRLANGALSTFMLSDTAASNRSWEHASVEDQARFALAQADDADCNLVCGTRGSLAIPTMRLQRYGRDEDRSWHKALQQTPIPLTVQTRSRRKPRIFTT